MQLWCRSRASGGVSCEHGGGETRMQLLGRFQGFGGCLANMVEEFRSMWMFHRFYDQGGQRVACQHGVEDCKMYLPETFWCQSIVPKVMSTKYLDWDQEKKYLYGRGGSQNVKIQQILWIRLVEVKGLRDFHSVPSTQTPWLGRVSYQKSLLQE